MRRSDALAGLLLLSAASAPARVRAESTEPSAEPAGRFTLGLRTGYGVPLGVFAERRRITGIVDDENAISDDAYGVIPLWLDVGYRLTDHILLGAYGMYGLVLPKTAPANDPLSGGCPEGFDCSASGWRVGLRAEYSFMPRAQLDPWLGLGAGYERIATRVQGEALSLPIDLEASHWGFDVLQLQGGADLRLSSQFLLGPFVSLSAMQYVDCSAKLTSAGGEVEGCDLEEKGWHGWLAFGVRGVLEL